MVSIIIPAYNAEKYIAETIKSVVNQTYKNWELIIVDDGSTDNTVDVITGYMNKDFPINYVFQKNSGVSTARNKGLSAAQGEYIALLDADDIWLENNLEIKISTLEKSKDIYWVYSSMYQINEKSNILKEAPKGTDIDILNSILIWENEVVPGPCSNIVFKRECYDNGCAFDPLFSTAADQDFTIRLASKYKATYIDIPLWGYRIHQNNMSSNVSLMEKDHIGVYKKTLNSKLFK